MLAAQAGVGGIGWFKLVPDQGGDDDRGCTKYSPAWLVITYRSSSNGEKRNGAS